MNRSMPRADVVVEEGRDEDEDEDEWRWAEGHPQPPLHRPMRTVLDASSQWDADKDFSLEVCPECKASVNTPLERVMGRTRPTWVPDYGAATLNHARGCSLYRVGPKDIREYVLAARVRAEEDRRRALEAHELERRRVSAMERQAAALEALASSRPKRKSRR